MRITVLSDNLPARGLEAEWGLSLYLEYQGHALLLDTGASDLFARNADALGLDLGAVALGVLSHAHWDHADGMDAFFARNAAAPFYLRQGCGETCFDHFPGLWRYEGPRRGLLARFASSAARVFGLDGRKGALGVGLDADAVLIDPGRAWTITAHSLRYLNPFSAFEGLEGVGLPVCTVVRGRVVAREGNVLAPFGHGLFQPRKS